MLKGGKSGVWVTDQMKHMRIIWHRRWVVSKNAMETARRQTTDTRETKESIIRQERNTNVRKLKRKKQNNAQLFVCWKIKSVQKFFNSTFLNILSSTRGFSRFCLDPVFNCPRRHICSRHRLLAYMQIFLPCRDPFWSTGPGRVQRRVSGQVSQPLSLPFCQKLRVVNDSEFN